MPMDEKAIAAVKTAASETNVKTENPPGTANDLAGKAVDWTSLLQLTSKGMEWRRNYFRYDHFPILPPVKMREYVCVSEVKNEFLGYDKQTSQAIGKIIDEMEGWEKLNQSRNFGVYGPQRAWKRVDNKKPKE